MGSMICMNEYCATAAPAPAHEWTQGWPLRSGGIAYLCAKCGSAYKNSSYCDLFHQDETGWRECRYCGKRLHCGCIASSSLLELVDFGGVMCINCSKSRSHPSTSAKDRWNDQESSMHLHKFMADEPKILLQTRKNDTHAPVGELEQESMSSTGKAARSFSNAVDPTFGSSKLTKLDDSRLPLKLKNIRESLPPPSLNISLASQGVGTNVLLPFSSGAGEGSQGMGLSSLHQGPRSRPILPKLRKSDAASPETTKLLLPPLRIARPPAEGRGKNQLLPRYWPRITDQELQQLSGDLNSTIEPLFEKVLSASDAGRIGRLVLPKACAEAYFPPISQSEGIPLRIQDAQGNEWTFQFRFWPNNNSRMYVLEGVTPCIQAMQLQAGDTVIFSRRDPGGKLVMGFRKASNSSDSQVSIVPNVGDLSREGSFQTFMGSPPAGSGYPGLIHTVSGTKDPQPDLPSELVSTADGDINWQNTEDTLSRTCEYSAQQSLVISEKKRTRNIGSKSRRMLIRSEDVLELRLTWEEAQDLLQPPPNVKPSLVTIEGHVFEEYDEPPVFGKRTIFVGKLSGGQEQWVQCDHCSKWRKLPVDVHLPPKWTCSDNVWDTGRRSCSAPEEVSPEELESLFILKKDAKRQRVVEEHEKELGNEMSGLDALASAAVLGEGVDDVGEPSSGATTRHPRHRPGCTCIVCIQPPSGKGKHKPTCTCNVCMTVKRRFKTMMLRKKKRQSEREAGATQKCRNYEIGHDEAAENVSPDMNNEKNEGSQSQSKLEAEDIQEKSSGHIDLNCHPEHETRQQLEGHCLKSTSFT